MRAPHTHTHSYVLDQILSGAPLDDVIECVLGYLQELSKDLLEEKVPIQEFIITKVSRG